MFHCGLCHRVRYGGSSWRAIATRCLITNDLWLLIYTCSFLEYLWWCDYVVLIWFYCENWLVVTMFCAVNSFGTPEYFSSALPLINGDNALPLDINLELYLRFRSKCINLSSYSHKIQLFIYFYNDYYWKVSNSDLIKLLISNIETVSVQYYESVKWIFNHILYVYNNMKHNFRFLHNLHINLQATYFL